MLTKAHRLTAAMDGFFVPGAGCVTSAPITITGLASLPSKDDLHNNNDYANTSVDTL